MGDVVHHTKEDETVTGGGLHRPRLGNESGAILSAGANRNAAVVTVPMLHYKEGDDKWNATTSNHCRHN
jgi:hypothetical protein